MPSRRRILIIAALLGLACASLAAFLFWPRPKWNVLLITLDTTRADHIGCYGHAEAATPVLDALAASGVLFEHAYSPVPMTLPAHATVLTGLYPPEHGLRVNGAAPLAPVIPTLAEALQAEGYETGAFLASFVLHSKFGLNRGFRKYDDDMAGGEGSVHETHLTRSARLVADSAIRWIKSIREKPFFAWVHLYDPHAPFDLHEETFGDRFRDRPYDGEIAFADLQIGRLLKTLRDQGLDQQTIVLVVGDHGEGLGDHEEREHSLTLYNSVLHVPLIVSTPEAAGKARRISGAVSLADIAPTLLDCLRVRGLAQASGKSFRKALSGGNLDGRESYAETDAPFETYGWSPLRSLGSANLKYIRTTREELYDIARDPAELHNLAAEQPEVMARMRDALTRTEQRFIARGSTASSLSEADRRKLESLGYASGSSGASPREQDAALPDIKDMLPWYNREADAEQLLHQGKASEAEAELRTIAEAVPDFIPARITLGRALEHLGRKDESADTYTAILKSHPESYDAHFALAELKAAQGHLESASTHYSDALKIRPQAATARANLANLLVKQGQVDEALDQYRQALEDSPDSVIAHFNLGMVMARQGNAAAGLPHVARAVELNPAEPEMHFGLGTVLLSAGRPQDAALHFRMTLQLKPGHVGAARQLRRLESRGP
jgi:arylsulfatase A-like enzyme/Flp pilus assembly protein TadD